MSFSLGRNESLIFSVPWEVSLPLEGQGSRCCGNKTHRCGGVRKPEQIFLRDSPKSRLVKMEGAAYGWGINWP